MTYKILDSWVSEDPHVMETFLTTARERYTALEQALDPIVAAVSDLEKDWKPRWKEYWTPKLVALASVRVATQVALQVFEREQSTQAAPLPVIITATSISYRCDLHTVENKIEEAGILLTAYLEVCTSQKEQHIRQRQKVLKALQAVVNATHAAIKDGRSALEQAPRRQQELFTPRPARQAKRKGTSVSLSDDAETRAEPPLLQVVRAEEVQP